MPCKDCLSRKNGYNGIFNINCPECRTAIAMSEDCKMVRSYIVDSLSNLGGVENWQAEPHCGCVKTCKRMQNKRDAEQTVSKRTKAPRKD